MYRTEKNRTEAWVLSQKRLKDWALQNQGTGPTLHGRLYLAKPYSAKSESAVQESAKPYSAKPYSAKPESAKPISGIR